MIDGVRLKICGLTSLVDAEYADKCGADYFGFIFAAASPRRLLLAQYRAMARHLPERKRVAVLVEPAPDELARVVAEDFEFVQIHFRPDLPPETVAGWSAAVTPARLWLAPKLPPEREVPPGLLPLAQHVLLDTYHAQKFGGTGLTGDWPKFRRHQAAFPQTRWILSGGLNPENVGAALLATDARFLDVNSGVESAPGIKDQARLRALVLAMHRARTAPPAAIPPAG